VWVIRKIKLGNWRSHASTELTFGKGTNIIIGIMGAGKSSVLEGICFGLFGTFPALQQKKLRLADVITNRPSEMPEASVEIEFDANGQVYTVMRTIARKRGGGGAELRMNGKLLESGPGRVNDYVEKLLKIDYDLFTRAIYSEQNRIDYFLTLSPGERKKKIDELLGIDRFETVRANVRTVINKFKTETTALRTAMAGADAGKLQSGLSSLEKEDKELKHKLSEGEKQAKTLASKQRAANSALELEEAKRRLWMSHEKNHAGFERSLSELRKEIAAAEKKGVEHHTKAEKELEKLRSGIAVMEERTVEIEGRKNKVSTDLGSIKAKFDNLMELAKKNEALQKELAALTGNGHSDSLRSHQSKSKQALDTLRKKLADADAALSSLESAERELEKAGAKCPVCEEPLGDVKKRELIAKRKGEVEKAKQLASGLKSDVSSNSKALEEIERKLSRAVELQAGISRLDESELKRLKSEAEKLNSSLTKLSDEAGQFRKQRTELENSLRLLEQKVRQAEDLLEKRARLIVLEQGHKDVVKELSKLAYKESEFQKAHADLRKYEGETKALDANLGNWQVQSEKLATQLSDLRTRLSEMEKQTRKMEGWERTVQDLEILGNAVVDVQAALRSDLIDSINSAMNAVWNTLYPYGDYSQLKFSASEAGYELELGDGERWVLVDGVASGGERACASLALRIAFARILASNLNWLILDEPTHNLDTQAVKALALALRDSIPSIVDQVFVITHEEGLKEAASGRLYMLDRNKRKNEATSSELLT